MTPQQKAAEEAILVRLDRARPNGRATPESHAKEEARDDSRDEQETPPSRFAVKRFAQFRQPAIPKLVHRLIAHDSFVLVYGGWGSGKSFLVVDLLCNIACGHPWRGRDVDQGAVVYLAGEAPGSIENRVRAWLLRNVGLNRSAEPPIGVIGSAPDLLHSDVDLAELGDAIEAFRVEVGQPLRIIAFDTLHACAPGSREDAGDTGTVLARVKTLVGRFGCAVVLVHHSGKDAGRGARGSNSLEAAFDVIVEAVDDGEVRTPISRKTRDGVLPELAPFVIESVTVGRDEDGEPIQFGVHCLTEPKTDPGDPRKAKAKALRKDGDSYEAIGKALGVTKTTAFRWCREQS